MTVQCAALRVNKSVLPSGENVGDPSLAGPEITPGANKVASGNAALSAHAARDPTRTATRTNIFTVLLSLDNSKSQRRLRSRMATRRATCRDRAALFDGITPRYA